VAVLATLLGIGDRVLEESGVAARGGVGATFLAASRLQKHVEILAIGADSQALESLVVLATLRRIRGRRVLV
jgi:hypothetical protein